MAIKWTAEERALRNAARKLERSKRAPPRERIAQAAKLAVEAVVLPTRIRLTPAQKKAVHTAWEGRCWVCGSELPLEGPEVHYDHMTARMFRGADHIDNLAPICRTPCHAEKTAAELGRKAKADSQRKKHIGKTKPKRRIASRGFDGGYQPLPTGRGFR